MLKKSNLSNITKKWLDILAPFSGNYSARISASELSKLTKQPQQTTSRVLNKMAKLNIVNYTREGRNKLFYLDMEKQTTKIILNLIENNKALKMLLTGKEVGIIINEILKKCQSLIVFGSYAAGNFNKESDLDLLILGEYDRSEIKKIKQKQTIEIHEHYASYDEFSRLLESRNPLAMEILKNHVLFGDICRVVDIFWRREYERR